LLRMSRHKCCKPACVSTVPISIPKLVVLGGILIVGSMLAVCVDPLEPVVSADVGADDFEEEPEDPAQLEEDVVDADLSTEMDEVMVGRTALAFGAGSAGAVGLASEASLAAAVGGATSGVADGGPLKPPRGFAAKACGLPGAFWPGPVCPFTTAAPELF
jgi:hypothetical protein